MGKMLKYEVIKGDCAHVTFLCGIALQTLSCTCEAQC
jgi:hypothetical protein